MATFQDLCEAALQTETKHDTSVIGGLVQIAEHNHKHKSFWSQQFYFWQK